MTIEEAQSIGEEASEEISEAQCSCEASEEISETQVSEDGKNIRYKIFPSHPSSLALFVEKLLKDIKLKDVLNPTVMGYVLKRIFLSTKMKWNVTAMRILDTTDLQFSSIQCANEQQSHHITNIQKKKIHFFKPGHGAIDAVFVARDSNDTEYLILIQVSLRN